LISRVKKRLDEFVQTAAADFNWLELMPAGQRGKGIKKTRIMNMCLMNSRLGGESQQKDRAEVVKPREQKLEPTQELEAPHSPKKTFSKSF